MFEIIMWAAIGIVIPNALFLAIAFPVHFWLMRRDQRETLRWFDSELEKMESPAR